MSVILELELWLFIIETTCSYKKQGRILSFSFVKSESVSFSSTPDTRQTGPRDT